MDNWKRLAELMVEVQIIARDVKDEAVLSAMREVPRHVFVPEDCVSDAYIDRPLPLGEFQTISQPFIVARMTELLSVESGMKILEIGGGSGYQAAVLSYLGAVVWSLERVGELVARAKNNLAAADIKAHMIWKDGFEGYPEEAPYDRIIITAAVDEIAQTWMDQLTENGLLVAPVKVSDQVERLLLRKKNGEDKWFEYCRFVPLMHDIQKERLT
ncbi:MAG: protein-L-isoaspartate(D-aspartate) O-methyltransferase [Synergistaceae bacterium]|nr:protein-L-isoaspartate(D-aspartate) O-methyltransferase [Synergistaceae bacterium]